MQKLTRLGSRSSCPTAGTAASTRREEASGALRRALHAANFALPTNLGDYGAGAVERMLDGDVLVVLLEFDPGSAGTALFSNEGLPALRPESFTPGPCPRPCPAAPAPSSSSPSPAGPSPCSS